ncbi:TlpA family protein disulfide reductase [Lysobacter niastensis]|uniref:TlpA family protein disulfide reductase n=1 Tax=Lysobacter niastensis TaxID=380629 RepID=A0ABS0BA95_9GAMM|nr:TlpA disulfide reductase family protein [Lysobacter niastensis]MBF6025793.1 TlpA family protein disulfide reductase [Lysobacter niastensis]
MPQRRPLLISALAPALLLVACQKPAPQQEAAPAQAPAAATKPEPAPQAAPADKPPSAEVVVPSLKIATTDGRQYDLAEHRGKWVVVNFWATWCKPCLKEMPELSALDTMREHVEVVGLAYEDIETADMQAFLKKHPVAYPIAIIDTYSPPADFDTPRGLPMTYLIGPDGKVADKFLGPVTAHDIEAAIAKAGGPPPREAKS